MKLKERPQPHDLLELGAEVYEFMNDKLSRIEEDGASYFDEETNQLFELVGRYLYENFDEWKDEHVM